MSGILPMSSLMYPSAPQMLPWSGNPNVGQVNPRQWRMLQFGTYLFPGTFQERNRDSKLSLIKKKIPFNQGDFNPGNTSMTGRTLEFYGSIGPGVYGSGGKILQTQEDMENERQLLSGLQALGRQSLYVGADRFIWAYLEELSTSYQEGTGFRVVDWSAKFYCDDPRYYGASSGPSNMNSAGAPGTGGLPNMNVVTYSTLGNKSSGPFNSSHQIIQAGNARAFPTFVLTCLAGTIVNPSFGISVSGHNAQGIGIGFSKFVTATPMAAGDILVVMCDPRPEYQMIAATYYPGGGWPTGDTTPVNGMAFCAPANGDFLNGIDFQYFLPWISSSTVDDGTTGLNQFNFGCGGMNQEHQIEVMYFDTYI